MSLKLIVGIAAAFLIASETLPEEHSPEASVPIRRINTGNPGVDLNSISVVTWNIDRGMDLSSVLAALKRARVDLLLLQEVDQNAKRSGHVDVAERLGEELALHGAFAPEFEELSQESHDGGAAYIGQATLTRLPVLRERALRFQNQSDFWTPKPWLPSKLPIMQRRLGGRNVLISELQFQGRPLVVYNAHLESRSYGRIQMKQLDEILADVQRNYPVGTAIILGGDLNTKYLPSLYLRKLERLGYRSCLGESIERTHTIAMALDWLFASPPLRFKSGSVRRDLKGSDHYPIFTILTNP